MPRFFAGLDWASRAHAISVVDELGRVANQFDVAHDAAGLREAVRRPIGANKARIDFPIRRYYDPRGRTYYLSLKYAFK